MGNILKSLITHTKRLERRVRRIFGILRLLELDKFSAELTSQTDLKKEADNLKLIKDLLKNIPHIQFPEVYFSTHNII